MELGPNECPRPVLAGKFSDDLIGAVVTLKTLFDIVGVTNIEATISISNNVNPVHQILAPEVGFEPTTNRLTADRSTTELLWTVFAPD